MEKQKIRVTKIFTFEAGHALFGYDGKCKHMHGHSYKLWVSVMGTPINDATHKKNGMVIDFGDLKEIVHSEIISEFDHAILLNENSPHKFLGEQLQREGHRIIFVPYQPTSENMVIDFAHRIQRLLPSEIELCAVRLQETETSYAEWFASDNSF